MIEIVRILVVVLLLLTSIVMEAKKWEMAFEL